jgi:hypothetical protein
LGFTIVNLNKNKMKKLLKTLGLQHRSSQSFLAKRAIIFRGRRGGNSLHSIDRFQSVI